MRSGRLWAVNSTCTAPGAGKRCSACRTRSGGVARPPRTSRRYGSTSSRLPGPPYAISSTETPPASAAMYPVHDALQRLDRRLRKHAVPEVEDVARSASGPVEHVADSLLEL